MLPVQMLPVLLAAHHQDSPNEGAPGKHSGKNHNEQHHWLP